MRIIIFFAVIVLASCGNDKAAYSTTAPSSASSAEKVTDTKPQANATPSSKPTKSVDKMVEQYQKSKPQITQAQTVDRKGKVSTNFNSAGIPDACDLMTVETIGKLMKIDPSSISLADGSSRQSNLQRACFFKWDGGKIKNAGVMVQLQKNPVADDVPEYFTYMVQSKKTDGENDFSGGKLYKYKDWPGFGDDGAYSTEAGKYVWRVGNDWAFMVAFNTELDGNAQKRVAESLAKEVMTRMTF